MRDITGNDCLWWNIESRCAMLRSDQDERREVGQSTVGVEQRLNAFMSR